MCIRDRSYCNRERQTFVQRYRAQGESEADQHQNASFRRRYTLLPTGVEECSVGQRLIARQIARARPHGPERPRSKVSSAYPCAPGRNDARREEPTRSAAALLPSQSVALTSLGETILLPEKLGNMRGAMPQISKAINPMAKL